MYFNHNHPIIIKLYLNILVIMDSPRTYCCGITSVALTIAPTFTRLLLFFCAMPLELSDKFTTGAFNKN